MKMRTGSRWFYAEAMRDYQVGKIGILIEK